MESVSSDNPTRFRIHQFPRHENPLHSTTLQNMSINLGPVEQSSMSDIYSEIGPALQDEMQRSSPPVPPRPVTSRQENLYDVPETDDARSVTSHTYTLPADARGETIRGSRHVPSCNTSEWLQQHHTASTADSSFGRRSPVLVIQQRYSSQAADVLDGVPVSVNRSGSTMSWQSQASSEMQETDTDSDDESGVRSESVTHEPLEAYLPPDHCWVMVHPPLVQTTTSVSPFRAAFTEDMRDTAELRPGSSSATESPPPPFTQTLLVSNTGKTSPAPSTSSGCTDLSKYSGDYERDPLYMERLMQQRAATQTEFSSSEESATYSPLSPVSPAPAQASREHHYTPLDCHRLEPTTAYSRLQRHPYETTV